MSLQDDDGYHNANAFVHVGNCWAFELGELWARIDEIEADGITLDQIGAALSVNWSACVVALALDNRATLYTLIAEATP